MLLTQHLLRTTLDQDSNSPKPGGLNSYQGAHKAWLTSMYMTGIKKLQDQYVAAAKYLTHPDRAADYAALPQEIKDAVDPLAGANGAAAAKSLCGGTFVYP